MCVNMSVNASNHGHVHLTIQLHQHSTVCLDRVPVVAKQLRISFFPDIIIVYRPQLGVSMHYLQIV